LEIWRSMRREKPLRRLPKIFAVFLLRVSGVTVHVIS
jgi:hypothetical protein